MRLNKEEFSRKIEEYKELGHEYRYRDQFMVQEFTFSMVAVGIVINALERLSASVAAVVQVLGLAFLILLTLHLRNTNQDRRAALARRDAIRRDIEFATAHLNADGNQRVSAPRLMVWYAATVAIAWSVWTVISVHCAISGYSW